MSGPVFIAFAGLLFGVLLVVVAALVWQEAKRRSASEPPTYVVEDAVSFVAERLAAEDRERLRKADIRRILEWELFYLQGLAQEKRWQPVETYAGGVDPAVEYVAAQIQDRHRVTYAPDDIRRVLRLEAEYLESIGAVGAPVEDQPLGGDQE